jgi:hypothetical protein
MTGPHPGSVLQNQPPPTPESKLAFLVLFVINLGLVVWTLGRTLYHEHKAGKKLDWVRISYAFVFLAFMWSLLLAGNYPAIPAKIVAVLGLHLTQVLAVVLVAVLGFEAYRFKLRSKLYFGMVEVVFGIASSAAVVTRVHFTSVPVSQMTLPQVTALVGSAFIVARGFTNWHEAKDTKS